MLTLKEFSISGLSEVTLSIKGGECIGLSGDSGCGKTRFLRAIADLDEHEGQLQLDEIKWHEVPANEWRQKVALLPAESQWWFDSVGEHFPEDTRAINHLGFTEETSSWESFRCSSGEKQRLSILRMLANQPRVLLLDEPTANLDESNSLRVEEFITDYITANKAIAIWVSHNPFQLSRVSNRQYIIEAGRLIENRMIKVGDELHD